MKDEERSAAPDAAAAPAKEEDGETLLEMVLAEGCLRPPPERIDGVVIGRLVALGAKGEPWVDFLENPSGTGVPARSMVAVAASDVGREVALLFEGSDPSRPVLMGLMFTPAPLPADPAAAPAPRAPDVDAAPEVERDGERLVFEADKEIVLRCGQASITLTRAGKILIKGAYLLARSSGVNRIQGGSVQIN